MEFLEAIRKNQVVVLVASTGVGKTTQLPCYLAFDFELRKLLGTSADTPVVCTEPRKISNVSACAQVCREFSFSKDADVLSIIGQDQDIAGRKGRIMYINEHAFLVHFINDPSFSRYRSQAENYLLAIVTRSLCWTRRTRGQ